MRRPAARRAGTPVLVSGALLLGLTAPPSAGRADLLGRLVPGHGHREALRTGTPAEQLRAARALGRVGDAAAAVAALAEALVAQEGQGSDRRAVPLQAAIVRSLARRGAAPELERALLSETASPRAGRVPGGLEVLASALGGIGTEEAAKALFAGARDRGTWAVFRQELSRMGRVVLAPAASALADPDLEELAVDVLSRVPDPTSVPLLVPRLTDGRAEVRMAALRGLARIGDPRAAPALAQRLRAAGAATVDDPLDAAGPPALATGELDLLLDAWAAVAPPVDAADLIEPFLAGSGTSPELRGEALRAWATVDPPGARPRLAALLDGTAPPRTGRLAIEIVLAQRHPAYAPLLAAIARAPERADTACAALAELDGGAGLPELRQLVARPDPRVRQAALRELAVGLRRWPEAPGRTGALALLADTPPPAGAPPEERWVLRALARDAAVLPEIRRGLGSEDPIPRSRAAEAAEHFPDPSLRRALAAALLVERPGPELTRRLVRALLAQRSLPWGRRLRAVVLARWRTSPVLLLLLGRALGEGASDPAAARAERSALRAGTRLTDPRGRALAARGHALAGDAGAALSLLRLAEDREPLVRLAAAWALAVLAPAEQVEALRGLARVEPRGEVRATLRRAAAGADGAAPPLPASLRGDQVARFRVAVAADQAPHSSSAPAVDVLLPDGDWRRLRPGSDGVALLSDLPPGRVDVRPLP